ncbi:hypothetical protein E6H36_10360 [Candidatus Bathyarchaeota archaeon]|nr:MAG: hypothetical protein E6H36_10360 [Candidatus Bathyarchaeota archaeon]
MRFIVDGMLGSLARWLRILGQEVVYDKTRNDNALLNRAIKDKMILLTRDEELCQRATAKRVTKLLVTELREEERIAQVAKRFRLSLEVDMAKTRCPECGKDLRKTPRSEISHKVPAKSLALYEEFWECKNPECAKVYWIGGHWRQITSTLAKAKKIMETIQDTC